MRLQCFWLDCYALLFVGSSLEQFRDIFLQENCIEGIPNQEFPIDANLIQSLKNGLPATSYTIFEVSF